jgi:hypothetical protein
VAAAAAAAAALSAAAAALTNGLRLLKMEPSRLSALPVLLPLL